MQVEYSWCGEALGATLILTGFENLTKCHFLEILIVYTSPPQHILATSFLLVLTFMLSYIRPHCIYLSTNDPRQNTEQSNSNV